jgi:hypothetical protein
MAIQIGQRLGPYEVLSAIGAGGMGEVYQAHDTKLGRDVAIKVLPCSDQGSTGQSEHLVSEDSSILRQGCCGRRKSGLVDAFESANCSKPAEELRGSIAEPTWDISRWDRWPVTLVPAPGRN